MSDSNPSVAVIDDDMSVGRAVKRLLQSVSIGADTYPSGDEFLDTLAAIPRYRPGCVILDIQMPGTNGLEVQRRLSGSGIPVILTTAYDDAGVRSQGLALGAFGNLCKPFNAAILIQAVQAALGIAPAP
ncbi:response regulator [Paraburkholderia sp. MMS20-SJTN17]|uniref:Response regulator n=1 Tax=Paraburkholderia translucens TaxID=2886945 RepID=A0ABS8KEP1_9BURK|nr:response regulator [Paraburkholderia sp. MMS20-SJTN17]MCC8403231.1 response regulator [Paraburkholderia sp. MMS20-SJTN17]